LPWGALLFPPTGDAPGRAPKLSPPKERPTVASASEPRCRAPPHVWRATFPSAVAGGADRHRRAAACRGRARWAWYNGGMEVAAAAAVAIATRRPRFRRADVPPPFRLTPDDVEIVRVVARHRLIRSTHIATLVGRSLDRTNDRLMRLFHAGYVDRPRAQLDHYPMAGSAPMIYALADRGVRLLKEWDGAAVRNPEWSRKNREAGRPFIEHQIAIVDFQVALQRAVRERSDIQLVSAEEMLTAAPRPSSGRDPFALRARLSDRGVVRDTAVVPDLVSGLELPGGGQRNFMVEIDRGTMPVTRSDPEQTSIARKMRVYLAAHAARQHERQFGWRNFRVLIVTTNALRVRKMIEALARSRVPRGAGASLFLFSTFDRLTEVDPLAGTWLDGTGRYATLIH
jgi:Replication-relaxation